MKCDRAFSQRSSLRTHELSHQCGLIHDTYEVLCTSQKQHPCIKCDKAFSQWSSLRTQELSHQSGLIHDTYVVQDLGVVKCTFTCPLEMFVNKCQSIDKQNWKTRDQCVPCSHNKHVTVIWETNIMEPRSIICNFLQIKTVFVCAALCKTDFILNITSHRLHL